MRELRPIRSWSLASSVAREVSWRPSCSFSRSWARIEDRTAAGVVSQAASEIPAGGVLITGGLCLRCNRESSCFQGFSWANVRSEPSRPLNGYRGSASFPSARIGASSQDDKKCEVPCRRFLRHLYFALLVLQKCVDVSYILISQRQEQIRNCRSRVFNPLNRASSRYGNKHRVKLLA